MHSPEPVPVVVFRDGVLGRIGRIPRLSCNCATGKRNVIVRESQRADFGHCPSRPELRAPRRGSRHQRDHRHACGNPALAQMEGSLATVGQGDRQVTHLAGRHDRRLGRGEQAALTFNPNVLRGCRWNEVAGVLTAVPA